MTRVGRPCAMTTWVTVHFSNNGVDFSAEGLNFTYNNEYPRIVNLYTIQEAGTYKARGPWSGNTEIYATGTFLLPSEHIKMRFVTYDEQEDSDSYGGLVVTGLKMATDCFYDSPTQIRCISPRWYPNGSTSLTLGDLKPCFETNVDVSNDNGTRWSRLNNDNKFLYCPVYVSTYGSNSWGEGTPRLPFRDISRAIMAALSEPRAYFIRNGKDATVRRFDASLNSVLTHV